MMRALGLALLALFATSSFAQSTPSERYENPLDGRAYVAPGGWQTHMPQGERAPAQGKIRLDHVRFLSSDSEIGANVGADALVRYIKLIEKQAEEVFGSSKAGAVLLQVNSAPEHQDIQLGYQGELDERLIAEFYDRLMKMERLKVKNSGVAFMVQISVAP